MVNAVKEYFTNYFNFKGRTSRATFWWTVLGILLMTFVVSFIATLIFGAPPASENIQTIEDLKAYYTSGSNVVTIIWTLLLVIPSLAMSVRRLHDINKSGWFYLLSFIPFVGSIILFIFYCLPAVNEGNNY